MEYTPDEATVIRDGITGRVHSNELVPGDIVRVAVGDKIPADCRVVSITSASFTIDQAVLTGESVSILESGKANAISKGGTKHVFPCCLNIVLLQIVAIEELGGVKQWYSNQGVPPPLSFTMPFLPLQY